MALTPFRWIAAAVAGCLVLAVVILRFDSPSTAWGPNAVLESRTEYAGRHATSAALRLRTAQIVDSLEAAEHRADTDVSIHVWRDAALPAGTAMLVDGLAARAVADVRDSGKMGIDIDFVLDTATTLRHVNIGSYGTYVDYVLPRRTGESCRVIVHLHEHPEKTYEQSALEGARQQQALATRAAAEGLLGPCKYYRAFGMPGSSIESWLKDRAAPFAGGGSWQRAAERVDLEKERRSYSSPLESMLGEGTSMSIQNEVWHDAVQCLSGDRAQCEHSLLARQARRPPIVFRGNVLLRDYAPLGLGGGGYEFRMGVGRREPTLFADMVADIGREKFARFWTSDASVPVAFQTATGTPLGEWMFKWLAAKYGDMPARGAGISVPAAIANLVLIMLFVGIALRVSERRQFA